MSTASALKIALMCATTAAATTALAAPAHADLYPNACLYIDNTTSHTATITVHSSIIGDQNWDIRPYTLTYLEYDNAPISTVTGGWNIGYLPAYAHTSWRYESDWAPVSNCNGSWVFTLS
ncbi:hypothetical protein VMT65_18500 [Nocardia sp. CDC153]|uniref:hypothetical protein n=1 Tax=Nocardia sp. CDC153 TaxID=3112167 RepID=UPI002DBEB00D|nr:hypothetical protein [Nocardia sp. CDC153]MEC3955038.1 hypothetical protein [Nocardia sp. CDC153]